MAQKYILIDNELIFGNTEFHFQLIPSKRTSRPVGGGRFHWDRKNDILYLYGKSEDFGYLNKEQFIEAWKNSYIPTYWDKTLVYWSYMEMLGDALNNYIDITNLTQTDENTTAIKA